MAKNEMYLESQAEVAEYLGLGIVAFLTMQKTGKFGVSQRPKDPTMVWWKCDIDQWLAAGRPVAFVTRDPSGVRR